VNNLHVTHNRAVVYALISIFTLLELLTQVIIQLTVTEKHHVSDETFVDSFSAHEAPLVMQYSLSTDLSSLSVGIT